MGLARAKPCRPFCDLAHETPHPPAARYTAVRAAPREEKMKQREFESLDKAIDPSPARKRNFKRIAGCALFGATMALVPLRAWADSDDGRTIPANGDLNP